MLILTLVGVFTGTVLLLVGGFAFLNRRRLSEQAFARERLMGRVRPTGERVANILREDRVSEVALLNDLLSGKGITDWAAAQLAMAGSSRSPGEFLMGIVVGAVAGALLGWRYGGGALGLAVGLGLGTALPIGLVRQQQTKRARKFEEQLPEALDMLVNALRAGYSLQAGMEFVGNEVPAPLGPEFSRFYDEQRLGIEVRTALLRLQERVGTYDIKMFVTALLIQRETGGNLAEVLANISGLMRERVAFRGQVDTLTAEPKMSARVLTALPVGVFLLVLYLSPAFLQPLLTTPAGHSLLAYAVASVCVGYVVLMRIAKIDL